MPELWRFPPVEGFLGTMIEVHQGSTSDLLRRLVLSGEEWVTLVTPQLPAPPVLEQTVIVANQHSRRLRVVTSLHGPGPVSTRRQIDGLVHLANIGVKVKATERGLLPTLLLAPPEGCCILPSDWGWGEGKWQHPVIIDGASAAPLFGLGDRIWKQAGPYYTLRRLRTARRWLEDIAGEVYDEAEARDTEKEEVELAELTLFDKRRGSRRKSGRKESKSWWTFHGTADDRVNPFLPVRIWAAQRSAHKVIRFPAGRRPTGVRSGDSVFFVVLSRRPGADAESYIVGSASAVAYRPLIDDATDEERASDSFLQRFPHALRLERVRFIRGAIGEGVPAHSLMARLGAQIFESTRRNMQRKSGNIDPVKSLAQKSIIRLAEKGARETHELLDERMSLIGCVTAREIERYEGY